MSFKARHKSTFDEQQHINELLERIQQPAGSRIESDREQQPAQSPRESAPLGSQSAYTRIWDRNR
jgi:hypothetical protein